jgi:hypothetical protein
MQYPSSRSSSLLSSLALALLLLFAGSCAENAGTSIRISLVYQDGWRMEGADVILSQADKPPAGEQRQDLA